MIHNGHFRQPCEIKLGWTFRGNNIAEKHIGTANNNVLKFHNTKSVLFICTFFFRVYSVIKNL